MYSVYLLVYFIIYITGVVGFIQITKNNKILLVIAILIILAISWFAIIGVILSSKTVKIITIENQKIVVESWGLPDDMDYYYKYINLLFKSYNEISPPKKTSENNNSSKPEEKRYCFKIS